MILPERVLGRLATKLTASGRAIGPISLPTCMTQFLFKFGRCLEPLPQNHKRMNGVALDLVRQADRGGFGDGGMRYQRRFDFGGSKPIARHLEHIVDTADHPEVAILILTGRITCRIEAGQARPVLRSRSGLGSP